MVTQLQLFEQPPAGALGQTAPNSEGASNNMCKKESLGTRSRTGSAQLLQQLADSLARQIKTKSNQVSSDQLRAWRERKARINHVLAQIKNKS